MDRRTAIKAAVAGVAGACGYVAAPTELRCWKHTRLVSGYGPAEACKRAVEGYEDFNEFIVERICSLSGSHGRWTVEVKYAGPASEDRRFFKRFIEG